MVMRHQALGQNVDPADRDASVVLFGRFASLGAAERQVSHPPIPPLNDDEIEVRLQSIIQHRALRLKQFPKDMFADPAWDILLDLALAERQQRRVSVSSLCIAAHVPATTALRWINHMTEDGWLVRTNDRLDARRMFVSLSKDASEKMALFLVSLGEGFSV